MKKPRELPGVLTLGMAQLLAWASTYFLPAILADPIAKTLGVPSTWIFGAVTGAQIVAALLAPGGTGQQAVMCSESLWWRCHRRLIADFAEIARGVPVRHLMHDGTLAPAAVVLLLPYLVLTWVLWHVHRLVSREDCCHEVAPGLWLGWGWG